MRCMMCGEDMVLRAAVPAETGGVQGFETQTHQCPACLGTERRFIFVGTKTKTESIKGATATVACAYPIKKGSHDANGADKTPVYPRSSIKLIADPAKEKCGARHDKETANSSFTEITLLPSEPPLIKKVGPGQTWLRAVEKFRRYEADLHERVEKTKTTNPNLGATKASDRITIPANDEMRPVNQSHNAPVGERLRRRRHAGVQERVALDREALRRFDELWNYVAPPCNAQKRSDAAGAAALFTRLPPTVSLVAVDADADIRGKRVFKKILKKVLQCLEGARSHSATTA